MTCNIVIYRYIYIIIYYIECTVVDNDIVKQNVILYGVSTYASTPSSSLCKTGGHETAIQGFEGNVGKSPRKSQVHLAFIVHVGRIRRKDHERSIACLLGSGTYLECTVADVALRITKALLNWKCFCAERSPVMSCQSIQPLRHYAQGVLVVPQ